MVRKRAAADVTSVAAVLAELERRGSKRHRDGMARYGIVAPKVFGVSVATLRDMGRKIGKNQRLAEQLWATGWYEARMLVAFVGEPAKVTPAQMNRWAKDFDNWAICDSTCFHLFDKTPHAWRKVDEWATRREEFVKRGAFALMASIGVHDKRAEEKEFLDRLPLIEAAASDDRNFVKKAVSWALRVTGRRTPRLHRECLELARRLKESTERSARWIGSDAYRELTGPVVEKRLKGMSKRI